MNRVTEGFDRAGPGVACLRDHAPGQGLGVGLHACDIRHRSGGYAGAVGVGEACEGAHLSAR